MTEFIVKLAQAGTVGDRQMNKSRRQLINGGDVGGGNLPAAVFPLGGIITDQERVEPVHHIGVVRCCRLPYVKWKEKKCWNGIKERLEGRRNSRRANDEERDADGKQREEECESVNEAGE